MVEFEGLSDRLYRVVRLAAKETGKQVRLDIVGGSIEIDRGVLDRMTGAFEHLLRNCVSHGIELPDVRKAAGKDPTGTIVVALSHEGNEVGVEFRDDGGGLDLAQDPRQGRGDAACSTPGAEHSDAELANLIFTAGFSTVDTVTELAGRGVGMDVVRADVIAMGGRIETATAAGQGTSFKLVLPLTTAVTQVVMLRCGESTVAVPSTLVEIVRRATPAEIDAAYASGAYEFGDSALPFFWLGALLQLGSRPGETPGADAHRRRRPQRPAADRRPRRRSPRQPGSRRQEPRPAAVAPARPRRHDAARLGRGGADLQPGRAGDALRRRRARDDGAARRRCAAAPAERQRGRPRRRRRWSSSSTIRSPCAASPSACWCARATA